MCGIFGAVLKDREAKPVLIDGLKRLEYRGYDSAGIAVMNGSGQKTMATSLGKVANLEIFTSGLVFPVGANVGIAHTRWATHGAPSAKNAHPQRDCKSMIYTVCNGIIDNHEKIRKELTGLGHIFFSETDTEMLAHLIEENKRNGMALFDSVAKLFDSVSGSFGVIVMDVETPDILIGAKRGSPIMLGIGEGGYFLTSDVAAIASKYASSFICLEDGDLAIISHSGYNIFDKSFSSQNRRAELITWTVEQAQKGGHEWFMRKEIEEQPDILERTICRHLDAGGRISFPELDIVKEQFLSCRNFYIIGCGTSFHAAMLGEIFLQEIGRVSAKAVLASEFRHRSFLFDESDMAISLSQSGETADTLAALRKTKKLMSVASIVNVAWSSVARESNAFILQDAGSEIGVASTKAFTSQILLLILMALYFKQEKRNEPDPGHFANIRLLPDLVRKVLLKEDVLAVLAKKYVKIKNFFFLGRTLCYPVAMEGALKLAEIAYVPAEAKAMGEMKHGPIALVDKNFPSIVIIPPIRDDCHGLALDNIREISSRNGPVIAFAEEGDEDADMMTSKRVFPDEKRDRSKKRKREIDDLIYLPRSDRATYPIVATVALQLFAYHSAILRGCDVDQPRNLAKSVTVE